MCIVKPGGSGHWILNFTGPQSFIRFQTLSTIIYLLLYALFMHFLHSIYLSYKTLKPNYKWFVIIVVLVLKVKHTENQQGQICSQSNAAGLKSQTIMISLEFFKIFYTG